MCSKTIVLVGNPNTGKSTIFNALTGAHQHTGNWSGKTVGNAFGSMCYKGITYEVIDLPGIYSVNPISEDEKQAVDCLRSGVADIAVVVLDATCLERNLILALELSKLCVNVIVCVNLMDEARRKGILVDTQRLSELINLSVVATSARSGEGIEELKDAINCHRENTKGCSCSVEYIYESCVENNSSAFGNIDRKIDRIVTGKVFAVPVMVALFFIILWLTVKGTNYPSGLLSKAFAAAEVLLDNFFDDNILSNVLIEGVFRTLSWVVAVMLPPMAIFFPLFTLLEDLGYLPRIAFNADKLFKKFNAHSKMVLTMCMGLGCNAVGVISSRIIESKKDRLIAIITNSFMPCNGRFAGLIMLASVFVAGGVFSSVNTVFIVLGAIISGVCITLVVSYILSKTILKGESSSFVLELPPYRKPDLINILIRAVREKILYVLGRAVVVSAPAGAVIWLMQNITVGGQSILTIFADFLNPVASLMGLDGYILMAFILGMPANEIVLPIIIMCYTGSSGLVEFDSISSLGVILKENGWTFVTALCTMIFSLNHFPCATTLLTIKKETDSLLWTAVAFMVPLAVGVVLCIFTNQLLTTFA